MLLTLLQFIFSTALIALATPTGTLQAESRTVRLGYLLDLSAKGAFIGRQSRIGAELAVRELRTEGTSVEIVFEDHQTDAKNGVTGARKLIDIDAVEALMCDLTPPCIAASPVAAAANVIFVYQAPVLSIASANKYAFKNFLDYEEGCRAIATHWRQSGIQNVSHFKVNAEFGELCLKGATAVFPSQQVFEYDAGTDLRALLPRVRAFRPQAVFQTGYEGDYINRLRASADLGLMLPTGMPQPLMTKNVIQSVPPGVLNGSVVFGFPPIAPVFTEHLKMAGLYSSDIALESAAIAYLHVKQLARSLLSCKRSDLPCQAEIFAASPPDGPLGFKGWQGQSAVYDYSLHGWRADKLVALPVKKLQ